MKQLGYIIDYANLNIYENKNQSCLYNGYTNIINFKSKTEAEKIKKQINNTYENYKEYIKLLINQLNTITNNYNIFDNNAKMEILFKIYNIIHKTTTADRYTNLNETYIKFYDIMTNNNTNLFKKEINLFLNKYLKENYSELIKEMNTK